MGRNFDAGGHEAAAAAREAFNQVTTELQLGKNPEFAKLAGELGGNLAKALQGMGGNAAQTQIASHAPTKGSGGRGV
jgi:hypothetical protein